MPTESPYGVEISEERSDFVSLKIETEIYEPVKPVARVDVMPELEPGEATTPEELEELYNKRLDQLNSYMLERAEELEEQVSAKADAEIAMSRSRLESLVQTRERVVQALNALEDSQNVEIAKLHEHKNRTIDYLESFKRALAGEDCTEQPDDELEPTDDLETDYEAEEDFDELE